jgi:toxin ParE1/3/4
MKFELSNRAKADIKDIVRYTLENFGSAQAEEYIDGLYYSLELLTDNPKLGREWKSGRRRYIYRMHQIYYRLTSETVFVTHIRHASQSPL